MKMKMPTGYILTILIIIVLAGGFGYMIIKDIPNTAAGEKNIKSIYNTLSGVDVEIISAKEENGLVKYTLKTQQNTVQDVYATKDGSMLALNVIDVSKTLANLDNQKEFAQCLLNRSVVVAGLPNDNYTIAQLQVLGAYSTALFFDCSGDNYQKCVDANITMVPTIFIGGYKANEGARPVEWFEQMTGCTMKK